MKLFELFLKLDESAKDRYIDMMPKVFREIKDNNGKKWEEKWIEQVNWATNTLKKQDRIVWYLRFAKAVMLNYLIDFSKPDLEYVELAKKEISKLSNKYSKEYNIQSLIKHINLTTLRNNLEHFLSLNLQSINNIICDKQDPAELIDQMAEIEQKWKEERKGVIKNHQISDNTKTLIKFPNGWRWVDLGEPYCTKEGEAMGHCGNAGNPDINDTVLSLREPVQGGWKPHLTFILNKLTDELGEMKGRGNDKPSSKYHPYIIELLKSPYVKGLAGGGYLPENNFQFSDLTDAQQDELYKLKPGLADLYYTYKKYGENERVTEEIDKIIKNSPIERKDDKFYFLTRSGKLKERNSIMQAILTQTEYRKLMMLSRYAKEGIHSGIVNTAIDILNENLNVIVNRDIKYNALHKFNLESIKNISDYIPIYVLDIDNFIRLINMEEIDNITSPLRQAIKNGFARTLENFEIYNGMNGDSLKLTTVGDYE